MATALELLSAENCDDILTVDLDSRVIIIPKNVTNLGVESDDNVRLLHFRLPRQYCATDLSEFDIRINYENAKGGGDLYEVKDAVVGEDMITFDWLVGRYALTYRGNVEFSLCLRDVADGIVNREFNTTIAVLPVLPGLETGEAIIEDHVDILEQWRNDLFGTGNTVEQEIRDEGERVKAGIGDAVAAYVANCSDDLKGPKGDPFTYDDFTAEQLEDLTGPKGDPFTYDDFTDEQLKALTGPKGDTGSGFKILDYFTTKTELENTILYPEAGDAYGIGVGDPYDIHVYSPSMGWVNNGPLQGTVSMIKTIYDPQNKNTDVFAYIDDKFGQLDTLLDSINGE